MDKKLSKFLSGVTCLEWKLFSEKMNGQLAIGDLNSTYSALLNGGGHLKSANVELYVFSERL